MCLLPAFAGTTSPLPKRREQNSHLTCSLLQDTTRTLAAFTHVDAAGAYAYWMGAKTAKQVDFKRLADALDGYRFAYLVTVDDDYRVHTVTVEPELREGVMDVGLIGCKTRKNVATRSDVTLLWPPSEPSGYSLIVDGRAEVTESDDDTARLRVVPTRALLHRNADPGTPGSPKDCLHDCVVFSEPQTFV